MSGQIDYLKYQAILRDWGYELCNRQGTIYLRRRPFTRDAPSPRQQRARDVMSLVAASNRGATGFEPGGLPHVCVLNAQGIRNLTLKVQAEERGVSVARLVADEIGLESVERSQLIALVRGIRYK